jgi:hypothetical protein
MKGRQFEQFSTEVLTQGAVAVLPQHLSDHWLNALLEEAELLQDDDEHALDDTCAGLLGAVILILAQHSGHPPEMEVAVGTLLRSMHYYILTLAAESVSRHTDIWVEPPTLENIFHDDRAMVCLRKASLH